MNEKQSKNRCDGFSKRLVRGSLATVLIVLGGCVDAQAAGDNYGGFDKYFHIDHLEIGPRQCVAEATIDYDAVLSNMSLIRDEWLSADKSVEFYQRQSPLHNL